MTSSQCRRANPGPAFKFWLSSGLLAEQRWTSQLFIWVYHLEEQSLVLRFVLKLQGGKKGYFVQIVWVPVMGMGVLAGGPL